MRWWLLTCGLLVAPLLFLDARGGGDNESPQPHRSPIDLAVLPGGQRILTANHTSDSASLIDVVGGKVVAEQACGKKPSAVASAPDGKLAAVSNLWSGTITLLAIDAGRLTAVGDIAVGPLPRGLAFSPDGKTLYAAISGADEVVQIDLPTRQVTQRWPAPREPYRLALSADGRWLAAASGRSGHVRCWDTQGLKLHWERKIEDGFNLRGLSFSADGKDLVCAHVLRREFPVSRLNIDEGWVIDSRLTRLALADQARPSTWQIALDTRGKAVGDPHGVAHSPDGRWLAVTASGTHELLLMEAGFLPWNAGDPGDHINVGLLTGPHKLRRVELGGRPLTVAFADAGRTAVVANYLLDAVQLVDVEAGTLVRSIPLGSARRGSPDPAARQGEAIFYDAVRSHHQWFSCHTCHTDGHTCGLRFDTLNDDSFGNPKLTPSLRNVTRTAPWTWHGWQNDLASGLEKSLTETMVGPTRPIAAEITSLLAYLDTLTEPPNPHRAAGGAFGPAAQRGKAIFEGKARCARCHKGELYTSESNYDVKLEADGSPFDLWNPPALLGLWDRGPYLHDSRARTLEELLHSHHSSEKLGGQKLTEEELRDLVEFLKAL